MRKAEWGREIRAEVGCRKTKQAEGSAHMLLLHPHMGHDLDLINISMHGNGYRSDSRRVSLDHLVILSGVSRC